MIKGIGTVDPFSFTNMYHNEDNKNNVNNPNCITICWNRYLFVISVNLNIYIVFPVTSISVQYY